MGLLKKIGNGFLTCFAMYTAIPMPRCNWDDDNLKYMFCFFPMIGMMIGVLEVCWIYLANMLKFGNVFIGAVFVCIPIFVTGGIHMDGFLDTMDAISSWRSKEERLRILKDSHAGAFAIISAGVFFVLYFGTATEITLENVKYCAVAFVLSRCMVLFAILKLPRANPEGTVAAFYQRAGKQTIFIVNCLWVCALLVVLFCLEPVMLLLFLPAVVWFLLFEKIAMGYFGGITGDLAGFMSVVSDLIMLIFIVVITHIVIR